MGSKSLRNTVFGLAASNYPYFDPSPDSPLPKMAERPKRLLAHFYPPHLENFQKIDPSRTWLKVAGKVVYAISINFRLLTFFVLSPFRAPFWGPKFQNGLRKLGPPVILETKQVGQKLFLTKLFIYNSRTTFVLTSQNFFFKNFSGGPPTSKTR